MEHSTRNTLIRQSAVTIVFSLIALELFFMIVNLILHLSNDMFEYFVGREYFRYVFTEVILFLITMVMRLIIMAQIILSWLRSFWIVEEKKIVYHTGVFHRKKEEYQMSSIEAVSINQSLMGRALNYGSIDLSLPILDKSLTLKSIPYPYIIADLISRHSSVKKQDRVIFRNTQSSADEYNHEE